MIQSVDKPRDLGITYNYNYIYIYYTFITLRMCVIYIYIIYIYTLGYQTTPRSSHPQVWVPYFFPYSFPYLFLRDSARLRLLNGQLEDYLNYLGLCVVLIQSLI